jgi:hypothetical protein
MTALQKIIKGAKSLQKKNKNLSWKDAIKKSSKAYNSGKKPVRKKAPVKKAVKRKAVKKTVNRKIASIKKRPVKKTGSHKDTKSHNVNIRVMSGNGQNDLINKQAMADLKYTVAELSWAQRDLIIYKIKLKRKEKLEGFNLVHYKRLPGYISHLKRQISSLKKLIK